ncbi:GNAT family N-acetyltransferase [Phreatobacter sp.]|uniref:GNAT family N-acetyltransferase n=1 Tax=Phreatobacter sp. TaxID=1966341 RepID=UPI0026006A2A|nr:GNAT family N-acetyltransferase [Phreatobacter sp.]
MSPASSPILRPATAADIPAITAIYGPNVAEGIASFEYEVPDAAEMARRQAAVLEAGYPYLVAETDGTVIGYAYASAYRSRPGYRFACENSVYVAPAAKGLGVGKALLTRLIAECTLRGYRQMIAVIGHLGNHGSIALHRACGFTVVGVLPSIGWKRDRWVDCVLMQRSLGAGDQGPPDAG